MATPVLIYGRESWTMTRHDERRIETVSYTHLDVYKRQI